ncbi:MAG: hypothetical protein HS130_11075 [Deltaproteobacteria bacterium]|nr:hypothetical protein [Deltaproteobacteria bacterium]
MRTELSAATHLDRVYCGVEVQLVYEKSLYGLRYVVWVFFRCHYDFKAPGPPVAGA